MEKEETYRRLEAGMLDYTDYADIPVEPNNEPLVTVPNLTGLTSRQWRRRMTEFTGEKVYVREGVARRLAKAALTINEIAPHLTLEVAYGYRALQLQRESFAAEMEALSSEFDGPALIVAAHRRVAVPEVAAHPAGAAVDIQLLRGVTPIEFGTKIWTFVPDSYTFSPFVSEEATRNRMLLRTAMMGAGFAPFDGEWWHFSYGDKEWARYYGEPAAMYEQVEFTDLKPQDPDV